MNTLLSILHLLVILTHNHLLPDMSEIWRQTQTERVVPMQTTGSPVLQMPIVRQQGFQIEAVRLDDKEKIIPISNSQEPLLYLLIRKQAGWSQRQTRSSKRYLVFCQLKTEG